MSKAHGGEFSDGSSFNADVRSDAARNSAPFHSPDDEAHAPFGSDADGRGKTVAANDVEVVREKCTLMADSFGMPPYLPLYPLDQRYYEGVSNVPWQLRKPSSARKHAFFAFLRSGNFWRQTEFAFRITLFAILAPAFLIVAELPNSPFVSTTYVLSAVLLASKNTVGEGFGYVFCWIRAGCIWLPIATIGAAINVGDNIIKWCVFYTAFLFVVATIAENMARRICLLLFNSCMIGLLIHPAHTALHPSRVMVDWCIGTGLCLFATLVPYPIFSKTRAQHDLAKIAWNTGAAFSSMTSCFWSESNVKRNMAMTKVRILTTEIDNLLQRFHEEQADSFYEFIFESWEVRDARATKAQLFELLRANLRGLARVLDIVEGKPWVVDDSDRSRAFGEMLHPHIELVSSSLDKLADALATANTFKRIAEKRSLFMELNQATVKLQRKYDKARRTLFYEHRPETLEEFVPLMTFFIFSVITFRDTMMQFIHDVQQSERSRKNSAKHIFHKTVWEPIHENIVFFRRLVTQRRRREIQRVIEAAKVSVAMMLAVGFSLWIDVDKKSLSGPNIIAFISASNPVEAVQASVVRLTGCILGTVLGFFAGTFSETSTQKIASLCTLIFVGTFFRCDKQYGIMAIYAMFVMVPLNTVTDTTTADTIARMNQVTFGILIYIAISTLVLPLSPGLILRKKRINILMKVNEALKMLCEFFSEPLRIGSGHDTDIHPTDIDAGTQDGRTVREARALDSVPVELNPSLRSYPQEDAALRNIDLLLGDIERRLKATYQFMEFARDERGLLEVHYPAKACEKTTFHLYRMVCLLRTMWGSWEVLRSQGIYAPKTRHILQALEPIALDASRSFSRFVDMLCYTLRDPSTTLETELMQVVLEFIQTADELHLRKNQILVAVIVKSVDIHKSMSNVKGDSHRDTSLDLMGQQESNTKTKVSPSYSKLNAGSTSRSGDAGSILPLLRKKGMMNISDIDLVSMQETMTLSESFVVPVTAEDAEGLHSFTLSMQMFADEAKKLLLSLEEILGFLRTSP